ncbi:MAG: HlyD family efflux transporter periplasmic adaptor subunit, partial [Bacteroidota bacterium]
LISHTKYLIMQILKISLLGLGLSLLLGCTEEQNAKKAYGSFEATTVMISAETQGKLIQFEALEGQTLEAGQLLGWVDTTLLHLQKQQLKAQMRAVLGKQQHIATQMAVYDEQEGNLQREIERLTPLIAKEAAPKQQLDDLEGKLRVVKKQRAAHMKNLTQANQSIRLQIEPLEAQMAVLDEQIRRAAVLNPRTGTVLHTFAEAGEMTSPGKPLYQLGDLKQLELRSYLSGKQLGEVSLGQTVDVWVDDENGNQKRVSGQVSWIASQAEFTPKSIQTEEARVNLVYAVKVKVKNPGNLRIGQPAHLTWENRTSTQAASLSVNP